MTNPTPTDHAPGTDVEARFRIEGGRISLEGLPLSMCDILIDALYDGHTGCFGGADGMLYDLAEALYVIQGQRLPDSDYGADDERREWVIELDPKGYSGRYMTDYGHTPETPREINR